jgi:hypothetical protein
MRYLPQLKARFSSSRERHCRLAVEGWVEYILEVYEVTTHDVNAPPSALSTYQPLLTEKGERAKALVPPTLPSVQDPDNEGDESPLLDAHASLYSAQRPWTAV